MKQLIIFCVALFVTHCILGVESSAIDIVEKLEMPNEDQYKTEFSDLDTDCLLIIVEYFSFSDLINVAGVNDEFSAFAADAYRRKYSHLPVHIGDSLGSFAKFSDELMGLMNQTDTIDADTFDRIYRDHPDIFNKKPKVEVYSYIRIDDYETLWNVFKHFGHEMKKLEISILFWEPREYVLRRALIGYLLSKYSSKSFVDIKMNSVPDRLLEHITKPMINVQSVSFSYHTDVPRADLLQKLATIFPNVRKFTFDGARQLKNTKIELKSVTAFATQHATVAPFHFPQLQTLHLGYYDDERFAEYLAFLNEHKHLSSLHIESYIPTDSEFLELTANLKDLVEVTLKEITPTAHPKLSPDAVKQFLISHENVKRLNAECFRNAWSNELHRLLQHGWNMTQFNEGTQYEGSSFERL